MVVDDVCKAALVQQALTRKYSQAVDYSGSYYYDKQSKLQSGNYLKDSGCVVQQAHRLMQALHQQSYSQQHKSP